MATIPFSETANTRAPNDLSSATFVSKSATLTNVSDDTPWLKVFQEFTAAIRGGTTFTAQIEFATKADGSDNVVIGTQNESERTARYEFTGVFYVRITLTAVTGGPVTAIVNQRED